jgi:arabinogalactan oligomer / maltooligosaccharide transport system permease protein
VIELAERETRNAARADSPARRAVRFLLQPAALGLLCALTVALALGLWFYAQASARLAAERQTRIAVMETVALADLVTAELVRAGDEGPGLAPLVAEAVARMGTGRQARVVRAAGARLLASTFPGEAGGGLPRRLTREEKWLFDLAQELRAAAETNRAEGGYRKDQIAVSRPDTARILVAVPYLIEGEFAGLVQLEGPLAPVPGPRARLPVVLLVLLPVAALLLAALALGRGPPADARRARTRRWLLAALALVLFGAVCLFASARLTEALRATVLADDAALSAGSGALRARLPAPPEGASLDAARWDIDFYQRPRGLLASDGTIRAPAEAATVAGTLRPFRNALIGNGVLGALVAGFFALGFAGRLRATLTRYRYAYLYVAPAMVGMLVLVFFPFAYGITLSFTGQTIFNTNLPLTELWVGLANYADIIGNVAVAKPGDGGWVINYQNFYWTLLITVCWTVSNVTVGVTFGMLLALALNTPNLRGKAIYRVLLILPWAIPNYITALIWKALFHQQFGAINQAVQMFGGQPVQWFDSVFASFMTGLATNGWLSFPFMMVVILGGLQSISADMYEAADLEGANRRQQFFRITLPLLKPTLVPAVVLSVVWTFNMFNVIYLVSGGEPAGANEILITKAYKIAFEEYRYAYSAAYSTVIFLILLAYGVLQTRLTRATEAVTT